MISLDSTEPIMCQICGANFNSPIAAVGHLEVDCAPSADGDRPSSIDSNLRENIRRILLDRLPAENGLYYTVEAANDLEALITAHTIKVLTELLEKRDFYTWSHATGNDVVQAVPIEVLTDKIKELESILKK